MNVYQNEIFPQRYQIQNYLHAQQGTSGTTGPRAYDPYRQPDTYRMNDYDRMSYLSASQQRLSNPNRTW